MNARIRVVASLVTYKFDPSFLRNRIIDPSIALTKTKMIVKQQAEYYDFHERETKWLVKHRRKRNLVKSDHEKKNNDKNHDDISYINLQVEPDIHPYLKRVRRFKHILDKSSPLLTQCQEKKSDSIMDTDLNTGLRMRQFNQAIILSDTNLIFKHRECKCS